MIDKDHTLSMWPNLKTRLSGTRVYFIRYLPNGIWTWALIAINNVPRKLTAVSHFSSLEKMPVL